MTSSIPLIRASAIVPIEYALRAAGRYSPEPFVQAGLPASPLTDPTRLVSFHGYFNLLDRLTESEGPDFGCRTATPETLLLLGTPAAAARASRTVRDALLKFSRTLHFHASHVIVIINMVPGGIEVSEAAPVPSSDTAQHAGHQQVAGLISALGRIINGEPLPARITLSAHPELGIEHLRPHLGNDITISAKRRLTMFIPDAALDMVLPWEPIHFVPTGPSLVSEQLATLTGSARALIEGMLRDGEVNLDRLALAAGRSRRTMQRLLQQDNSSFAELVDSVRQQRALAELNGTGNKVSAIASGMGYSNTSSLTRAVRRWTDAPPSKLRRTG